MLGKQRKTRCNKLHAPGALVAVDWDLYRTNSLHGMCAFTARNVRWSGSGKVGRSVGRSVGRNVGGEVIWAESGVRLEILWCSCAGGALGGCPGVWVSRCPGVRVSICLYIRVYYTSHTYHCPFQHELILSSLSSTSSSHTFTQLPQQKLRLTGTSVWSLKSHHSNAFAIGFTVTLSHTEQHSS